MKHTIDVVEDKIYNLSSILLETFLKDRSSNKILFGQLITIQN